MGLRKKARTLDTIDAIVGPATTLCYYSGSSFLQNAAVATSIAEVALLKLPFMMDYVRQTNDYKALMFWIPKEIFANFTPNGGIMDIAPTYMLRTNYIVQNDNFKS